ncbi:MAG: hypothetical protein ABEH86_11035 [Haloarcula sp.]
MRRRRLLELCGALVSGAGCQRPSESSDAVTPVPSPDAIGTSAETAASAQAEITDAAVTPAVVLPNDDSLSVATTSGQYLVLNATVEGTPLDRSTFAFRFDGTAYKPSEFENGLYRNGEWGRRFTETGGPLVFDLPEIGTSTDARVTWPDDEWVPPEPVRTRLEAPLPSFDVTLDGPVRVDESDAPTLEITVTNTGDVSGRYVIALNRVGPRIAYAPVGRFDGELEPGDTDSISRSAKSPYADGTEPRKVTYRLDAPGEDNDTVHRIKPAETETASES